MSRSALDTGHIPVPCIAIAKIPVLQKENRYSSFQWVKDVSLRQSFISGRGKAYQPNVRCQSIASLASKSSEGSNHGFAVPTLFCTTNILVIGFWYLEGKILHQKSWTSVGIWHHSWHAFEMYISHNRVPWFEFQLHFWFQPTTWKYTAGGAAGDSWVPCAPSRDPHYAQCF